MTQEEIYINGELLRLRREAGGWVIPDLATRACLSVKQIRQLEDGGMSSFYSQAVKATAAKKLGALLGLSPEEVFTRVTESEALAPELDEHPDSEPMELAEVSATAVQAEVAASGVDMSVHSETQPPSIPTSPPTSDSHSAAVAEEPKSKSSIWVIAGLFAAALAVAAYLQPHEEPTSEPVPPLLVMPSEEPASGASAAEASASAPLEPASVAVMAAKPSAAGAATGSSAATAAGLPSPSVSVVAAPVAVRAASALSPASAAAPAASKAP